MKCRNCGYEDNSNLITCPKCGTRFESISVVNSLNQDEPTLKDDNKNNSVQSNDNSILPLLLGLIILIIGFSFYYFSKMKDEDKFEANTQDNLAKYKESGYSFIDLYENIDNLDTFSLINSNVKYTEEDFIVDSDLFCNKINEKITFSVVDGKVYITYKDYKIEVKDVYDIKYLLYFHKDSCKCDDYTIAALSKDGNVYIYESEKFEYSDLKDYLDTIANGFKKIEYNDRISSIGVTSYIGEVNPCGEKVLVLKNASNKEYYFREGTIFDVMAKYAMQMYNIYSIEDKEYSLFINPDRTMQVGVTYSDDNRYITDENAKKIKYYGTFREDKSKELQILDTNGNMYVVNFENTENLTAKLVRNLRVTNIGYKFDLNEMKSKYVIMYSDGSVREYIGSFETHGIFSEK